MRAGPIVATLFVLGGIPAIVSYQHYQEEREKRAVEQIENSLQQSNDLLAAKALAIQLGFVQRTQGDAAAKLFQTCNRFPPTQPKGVLQCQDIAERMKRDMATQKP